MIKHYWPLLIIVLVAAPFLIWKSKDSSVLKENSPKDKSATQAKKKSAPLAANQTEAPPQPPVDLNRLLVHGQRIVGLPEGKEREVLKNLKIMNTPSPQWKENLISTLQMQAGDKLKDISIKKVDSYVSANDGIALFVESVVVTAYNQRNEESQFRILVDAQNGKILQSWDRPVVDEWHKSDEDFLKVDSRYQD